MPKWTETENEIRYTARDIAAYMPGSLFPKKIRASPEVITIRGRLRGETEETTQEFRFAREKWTREKAENWLNENKEKYLMKTIAELDVNIFKGSITSNIHALAFSTKEFSEKAVKDWLVAKSLDLAEMIQKNGLYSVVVRPAEQFLKGSIRDILLRDGITASIGILKAEFQKSIEKRVPDRFALKAESIFDLADIDTDELTLTRSPAVGKMAEWRIFKSTNFDGEQNRQWFAPICKVDEAKKQIGAYALVPHIPDIQGDRISPEEVEKAAHNFLKNLALGKQKGTGTGLEHNTFDGVGYPIESFFDRHGREGVKGGWFVLTQVTNDDVWKDVASGKIVGYSIGGSGKRTPAQVTIDSANLGKSDEGIIQKFLGWLKSEAQNQDTPQTVKKDAAENSSNGEKNQDISQTVKKDNQEKPMDLAKYQFAPSALEELKVADVDVEKATEHFENFCASMGYSNLSKALRVRFGPAQIGIALLETDKIIRQGMYGEFGNPNTAWGLTTPQISKSNSNNGDVQQPEIPENLQKTFDDMAKLIQKQNEAIQQLQQQPRSTRKSSMDIPDADAMQQPGDIEEDILINPLGLNTEACKRSLSKTYGYEIK